MRDYRHWLRVCAVIVSTFGLLFLLSCQEATPTGKAPDATKPGELSEISIPLSSGGKVTIDEKGLRVLGAAGELITQFDHTGSTHTGPETFQGGITVPLADSDGNKAGQISVSSSGLSIFDIDGNLVSYVDEAGSVHKAIELFEGGVVVPLLDSDGNRVGTIDIDQRGLRITDSEGNLVSSFDKDGSRHDKPEEFSELSVPLRDEFGDASGKVIISEKGIRMVDAAGNDLYAFEQGMSFHEKLEFFEGGINVPMRDEEGNLLGTVEIGPEGVTIADGVGNRVMQLDQTGSVHNKKETFSELVVPLIDADGNRVGQIQINEEGLSVLDADDKFISYVNETGSEHNKPEQFSEITVPLKDAKGNDVGEIVIGEDGLVVKDSDGNTVVSADENGLKGSTSEQLGEIVIPLANDQGESEGRVLVDENGITLFDADGNIVNRLDENGSTHNAKETFTGGIEIPLIDVLGKPAGKLTIDHSGVVIHDADDNLVSGFNQELSIHTAPETFTDISIPLENGGLATVNSKGISVYDADDNLVSVFDENGSTHNSRETFKGGITIPLEGGGSVTIDEYGLFVRDDWGSPVSIFRASGSTHIRPEEFGKIIVNLPGAAGSVEIGSAGIVINDSEGLVSRMDPSGSLHLKLEKFYGGIEVPLTGGGKAEISESGIVIKDSDGNIVSQMDENGSTHNSRETFKGGITIPLEGGGSVTIDEYGLFVRDDWGSPVSIFRASGSTHIRPEEFGKIIVNLPGAAGSVEIGSAGIVINDSEGLVSRMDPSGSLHLKLEKFYGGIEVPLAGGGKAEISESGIVIKDTDGNIVSVFDENGSTHNSPETFTGGISVPGGITFGANGAFTDSSLGGSAKVGIESSGFSVYDSDGNPLAWFSSDGSINSTVVNADTIYAGKIYAEAVDPLVMESFPVSSLEDYEPGDVLVIDPEGNGSVLLCGEANDTEVVGIVGPGVVVDRHGEILAVMLGAHGPLREDGTRLEARVKVDASYGAIQAGDLLTTSPTLGHAMKADDPKLGSILGKAMESLEEGQGLIKVYVTLQ